MQKLNLRAYLKGIGICDIAGYKKTKDGITIFPLDDDGNEVASMDFKDDFVEILHPLHIVSANGVDIYEGHLIKIGFPCTPTIAPVVYSPVEGGYTVLSIYQTMYKFDFHKCIVVGNRFDDKELMR